MFQFFKKIDTKTREFYIASFCAILVKTMCWVEFYVLHKLPWDDMVWMYNVGIQLLVYLILRVFVKKEYISLYLTTYVGLSIVSSVCMSLASSKGMGAAIVIVLGVYELGSILPTISIRIIEYALKKSYIEYKVAKKEVQNDRSINSLLLIVGLVVVSKIFYWCIVFKVFNLDIVKESMWIIYLFDLLMQAFVFFLVYKKVRIHLRNFLRLDFGLGILAILIYSICNLNEGGAFFGIMDVCGFFHVFLLAYIHLLWNKGEETRWCFRVDKILFVICIIALCGLVLYDVTFYGEVIVNHVW